MKNQILVQEIIRTHIPTGNSKDNGRYAEVRPLSGRDLRDGTLAEFFDRKGKKIVGKVVSLGVDVGNGAETRVVDMFQTV